MSSYPEPIRSDVKEMIRDYVLFTIHKDWPAHREGEVMVGGAHRVDAIRSLLARFEPETLPLEILHRTVIAEFHAFSNARFERLTGVMTRIPEVLWYALGVGAVINITLLVMLKMRPMPHLVLGTLTSFFLGVVLFVIVALDDPLRGQTGLPPEAMQVLWERQLVWDEPQG
jgi:hypothetical protein